MNRKYKRRLVKAMYKINDFPALDEYGSKIFGRPIEGSWKLFRNIVRMSVADIWRWSDEWERASYPYMVNVPTFDEFATFLLHEVTHGWCYFLKNNSLSQDYPTGVDEEQVCWDISKLVCEGLGISYQKELAELSHQFHLYLLAHVNDAELAQLEEKMPEHLRWPKPK